MVASGGKKINKHSIIEFPLDSLSGLKARDFRPAMAGGDRPCRDGAIGMSTA
jgi:hypothetical protein